MEKRITNSARSRQEEEEEEKECKEKVLMRERMQQKSISTRQKVWPSAAFKN